MAWKYLAAAALGVFLQTGLAVKASQDVDSVSSHWAGCRTWLQNDPPSDIVKDREARLCLLDVEAIMVTAVRRRIVCSPPGLWSAEGIRVVIRYIDARPDRMNEPFTPLVLEALQVAWPC